MDKQLQKEILKIFIEKQDFLIKEEDIINNMNRLFFSKKEQIPSTGKIKQQIDLLIDDNALVKKYDNFPVFYRMTEWGEVRVKGGIKKIWYWLINKNHNFISFIAVGISIILPLVLYFLSKNY